MRPREHLAGENNRVSRAWKLQYVLEVGHVACLVSRTPWHQRLLVSTAHATSLAARTHTESPTAPKLLYLAHIQTRNIFSNWGIYEVEMLNTPWNDAFEEEKKKSQTGLCLANLRALQYHCGRMDRMVAWLDAGAASIQAVGQIPGGLENDSILYIVFDHLCKGKNTTQIK